MAMLIIDSQPTAKAVKLLVLDLDGTVRLGFDELGRFVNTAADVQIFPEALEKMKRWKQEGGRIVAATNQGGVALGHLSENDCYEAIARTQELCEGLFDKICICIHHPEAKDPEMARCWCRKPSPGIFIEGVLELAHKHNEYYPPYMGLFVGDRPEDQKCAELAGFPFELAKDWRARA